MLARLRHWAIGRVHNQNRTIHLRRTRDHVFHIISMAGAIHMRVMTAFGFIFNMRRRNRDPAGFLFRRSVNLIIILKFAKLLRNRSRQCRLTMVNVTNRANVAMRLTTLKLFLCHGSPAPRVLGQQPCFSLSRAFRTFLKKNQV